MPAQPGGMGDEQLAAFVRRQVLSLSVEESRHGGLRVDHQDLLAGQPHHDIRSHRAAVARGRTDLLIEITAGQQPRHLQDPPQLHFAPRAAHR